MKESVKSKVKNSTKKEENADKTKLKMTEIQGFYELADKDTGEEIDTDVYSVTTKQNEEIPVLLDTEVT